MLQLQLVTRIITGRRMPDYHECSREHHLTAIEAAPNCLLFHHTACTSPAQRD
ncbi:hypothetical protein KNP414_07303 [Paenibacillus mucilaginosus KNP414]|uniref:Uncharacterized protein n=1 Tax=Paenibacillus mucilaginosus (strain KNP414) TaxID=1036673 RepID=F8FP34_PAEMK|nr:hypothetical protein KNP414_07303 [Paenibacillus mucilaginosus KNP414]